MLPLFSIRVAEWHLFGKELFIQFAVHVCCESLWSFEFASFPFGFFGFEGVVGWCDGAG